MTSPYLLMIDDNPDDFVIMQFCLSPFIDSAYLFYANDGKEGLIFLEDRLRSENLPSLLLLDLNMPRLNGTEILQILRSVPAFRRLPVCILSTSINLLEKKKCFDLGANEYLIKPTSRVEGEVMAEKILPFFKSSQ